MEEVWADKQMEYAQCMFNRNIEKTFFPYIITRSKKKVKYSF